MSFYIHPDAYTDVNVGLGIGTVDRILVLEDSRLAEFMGNYSGYASNLAARRPLYTPKTRRLSSGL